MANAFRFGAYAGVALSAMVALVLVADGGVLIVAPQLLREQMQAGELPIELAPILGAIAAVSGLIYAIPRTAVLGSILITGFLGGAICAHLRIGEIGSPPQILSLALGVMAWGGLYLRDARTRALLPFVRVKRSGAAHQTGDAPPGCRREVAGRP